MTGSRRTSRRTRLAGALALAVVAVTTLVLASPAVARPIVHPVVHTTVFSTAAALTVIGLAALVAVALITGAVLVSDRRPRRKIAAAELPAAHQARGPQIAA